MQSSKKIHSLKKKKVKEFLPPADKLENFRSPKQGDQTGQLFFNSLPTAWSPHGKLSKFKL